VRTSSFLFEYFIVLLKETFLMNCFSVLSMAYHKVEMFREDPSKPSGLAAAISVGWGIGASMSLILQAPTLFSALGPADLPAPGCPSVSAFHLQALVTLPIALLHILLSIILFDAYQRKSWLLIGLSIFLHFIASFAVRFFFWKVFVCCLFCFFSFHWSTNLTS
jgi:hypothetical protein